MGASRNYLQSDEEQAEQRRAHYIQSRRVTSAAGVKGQGSRAPNSADMSERDPESAVGNPGDAWGAGFRPRDKVETVRNCAALPRDFVEAVVLQVATALLNMTAQRSFSGDWNPGGTDTTHSEQHSHFPIAIYCHPSPSSHPPPCPPALTRQQRDLTKLRLSGPSHCCLF